MGFRRSSRDVSSDDLKLDQELKERLDRLHPKFKKNLSMDEQVCLAEWSRAAAHGRAVKLSESSIKKIEDSYGINKMLLVRLNSVVFNGMESNDISRILPLFLNEDDKNESREKLNSLKTSLRSFMALKEKREEVSNMLCALAEISTTESAELTTEQQGYLKSFSVFNRRFCAYHEPKDKLNINTNFRGEKDYQELSLEEVKRLREMAEARERDFNQGESSMLKILSLSALVATRSVKPVLSSSVDSNYTSPRP